MTRKAPKQTGAHQKQLDILAPTCAVYELSYLCLQHEMQVPRGGRQYEICTDMKVAELINVCWLDITGKIDTKRLTKKTSFAAYLVFKLTDEHQQLEKAIASVRFVKEKVEGTGKEGYTVFISKTKEAGEYGEVEMKLMETDDLKWKSGLIIKGIDIRPN
ncbi:hypothetical protein T459_15307 [Capsicum annuum]|uniref:Uncharacterized protein n=1 Tax=Capsicum annuum TaxID=4072 RepID=A0A2G2ZJW8_CAPAN|nr:hypothetical protein T459_15307 [Capsicum annuum]